MSDTRSLVKQNSEYFQNRANEDIRGHEKCVYYYINTNGKRQMRLKRMVCILHSCICEYRVHPYKN